MNHLRTLLDQAAGTSDGPVNAHADLARGHRARAHTRARRGAGGLVGVALVGALGAGLATRGGHDVPVAADPTPAPEGSESPTPASGPSPMVDPSASTDGIFAFGSVPPAGWELQGADPGDAVFAHPGDTTSPYDFEGKIVVMLDTNRPAGEAQDVGSRTFWVHESDGYTRVSTRTRAEEPQAVLSVQFPQAIAWPTPDAIAFLNDVQVLAGAQPGAG